MWSPHVQAAESTPVIPRTPGKSQAGKVPVIYCTDLFHPHVDPDDHFDLATVYALPEVDLKGIVLDQGDKQLARPGRIPVSQLNHLTGRAIPTAIGLSRQLRSPADQALDVPDEFQGGVRMILRVLRESPVPVKMIAVGSVRDVVAAFNREPELFRLKVDQLLVFIGEASDPKYREYNVDLDPQAYVGLMRSGLPVYWVPCFDGGLWQNRGHASFWKAKHEDLLRRASPALTQYFIYALEHERSDPIKFLSLPVNPERRAKLWAGERNLWCTAIFGTVSGRRILFDSGRLVYLNPIAQTNALPPEAAGTELFRFSAVDVQISDDAVVQYTSGPGSHKIMRFEIVDPAHYAAAMTQATAELLNLLAVNPSVDYSLARPNN